MIIGSGFSGLGAAIRLTQEGKDFLVLERGSEVGGTWRDNTYPGAACDVPSNLYSYSFALNPEWTRSFSRQPEIQRYIAESAADIQAARLMTLDAARVMDAGEDARVRIGLIKFRGAQMLHDVVDRAIQVYGALGLTADTPLEGMYRRARYARIYDGPDEVHRMSTARRMLRDPERVPWR